MIKVRYRRKFPRNIGSVLTGYSLKEYQENQHFLFIVGQRGYWEILDDDVPLLYCGVYRGSLLGVNSELWFMICKDFDKNIIRNLRLTRNLLRRLLVFKRRGVARVDKDFPGCRKFAEFMGFTELHRNEKFIYYGVSKW